MHNDANAGFNAGTFVINVLKEKARAYRWNPDQPFSNKLHDVQVELRERRKSFLGSAVQLSQILYENGELDYLATSELTEYLAVRTARLWNKPHQTGLGLCRQFFEMTLSSPEHITLDDIILFATVLTHYPKSVFLDVMTTFVSVEYHESLDSFWESYYAFLSPYADSSFEDSVLGAICMLLGVLSEKEEM